MQTFPFLPQTEDNISKLSFSSSYPPSKGRELDSSQNWVEGGVSVLVRSSLIACVHQADTCAGVGTHPLLVCTSSAATSRTKKPGKEDGVGRHTASGPSPFPKPARAGEGLHSPTGLFRKKRRELDSIWGHISVQPRDMFFLALTFKCFELIANIEKLESFTWSLDFQLLLNNCKRCFCLRR